MHVAVTSGRLFQGIYSQTSVLIFHLVSRDLLQTAPQLQVHYWLPLEAQRKLKTFGYRSHLRKPVVKGESLFTGRCFFFSFLSFLFFLSSSSSFFFFLVAGVLGYFGLHSIAKNGIHSPNSAQYFLLLDWRWVILFDCVWFSNCGLFNSRSIPLIHCSASYL